MTFLNVPAKANHFIALVAVFSIIVFTSCNQAPKNSEQTEQTPVLPQNQTQNNNEATETQDVQSPAPAATEQTPAAEQATGEVMLNPPHGEPFHRCDIPVGAPLNSAPATTARPATSNQVQTTAPQTSGQAPSVTNNPMAPTIENAMRMNTGQTRSTTQTTNNTGTKPRLNPAHGQPWHRCDIPVGSPLP